MARQWIGTSGWVYKHWRGIFYPPSLPTSEELPFYARQFSTVEVNVTFYRLPEQSGFEAWQRQSPPGFLFAVKGSRYLTHMKKLKEPEEPLARLMERASGLGDKLGPILFQLPPTWRADVARLCVFLGALRPYAPRRFAIEFRHESWLIPAVYRLLEGAGVALCLPVGPGIPLDPRLTVAWTYVRMHGGGAGIGFNDEELRRWAERLQEYARAGADAYVYFNNDPEGHAVRDAVRLRNLLSLQAEHGQAPVQVRDPLPLAL
jgi:uncharacterized protein YecE (DUF72 family)